jgi:hypothetical protein
MIEKIASSLGRSDDEPNVALAELLVKRKDAEGIREIAAEITGGVGEEDRAVASDCIKVLYEVGYRDPELILPHTELFLKCLKSRNGRLVWGACIALAQIADRAAGLLYDNLDAVMRAYETGGVIAVDNCVSIFAGIAKADARYEKKVFPIILGHLKSCRPKEVAQHAERASSCVNAKNAPIFKAVLMGRYESLPEPQKKRVDKLLRNIEGGS